MPPTSAGLRRRLTVGVAGAATAADPPAALAPGRSARTLDLDHADGAVAELLVEPAHHHRGQQPHLGRPGGRVGTDDQAAGALTGVVGRGVAGTERLRSAVLGDLPADDRVPPGEHAVDADIGTPALLADEPTD